MSTTLVHESVKTVILNKIDCNQINQQSMNFFKSILSDDTDPDPQPETANNHKQSEFNDLRTQSQSPIHHETEGDEDDDDSTSYINSSEDGNSSVSGGGLWSFGDLVKTLTTKSESVFETYRRDLKEFGTGLRKESDLFREVASRAVKDLPAPIDVGSSAIDVVLKSTVEIIAQGKETVFQSSSDVDESDSSEKPSSRTYSDGSGLDLRRLSRFDAQLSVIRSDVRTYCEDPEDVEDYRKWKLGFVVGDKKDEIEKLSGDDGDLVGVYSKLVPNEVDDEAFWCRYFYKVYKLKQQEDVRAKLVKRSLSVDDDDEELSWDVDDDDNDNDEQQQEGAEKVRSNTSKSEDLEEVGKKESRNDEVKTDKEMQTNAVSADNNSVSEREPVSGNVSTVDKAEQVAKSDDKLDEKVEQDEVKDSNNVVVKSSLPSFQEVDDLEWDEIEDIGDNDDVKVSHGDAPNKADLCKRLSTAVDEEDLNWDIEDDDEEDDDDDKTVKSSNK
ncbi:hypothetical protein QVD17_15363 [Tagetes erecta]|uniref:BSD domain-containing protein n=1 Tax=Tagetes erecta TaxID=13708 RepID=A0AAD8KVT4_TARER|nr:hypothetical protein QVD17_15363 [Tagetes erecta]